MLPRPLARACLLLVAMLASAAPAGAQPAPVRAMYADPAPYRAAIEKERPAAPRSIAPTGITTPHHLLAADLMARAFWTTAGTRYDRIILLSPDHFRKSRRVLATTRRGFETAFGPVPTDTEAAAKLLENADLVDESDLFEGEHGIGALLPLVRHFQPDTPVVAVTLTIGSTVQDWQAAADALHAIVTQKTLIIQSTDFSHYLTAQTAARRDQETLNIIGAADPAAIAGLHQSNHLDSKAALFVQMSLQARAFQSHGTVIANRNQIEYAPLSTSTTSYVVMVFTRQPQEASALRFRDQSVTYFGGDVFPGRWLTAPLARPETRETLTGVVRRLTGGGPMVVNLEGVMMDEPPPGISSDLHAFRYDIAAPMLKGFNVAVAGMANNHAFDLGAGGMAETLKSLKRLGIKPAEHMKPLDMGGFRLVALNYIGLRAFARYPAMREGEIERLCAMAIKPPVVAFVHWGEEYTTQAPDIDKARAEQLYNCGVRLIVGAHSHQAAPRPLALWGGEFQMVYSLGNLLFDQRSPRASSAILELRTFAQGTFAARLIPAPNLFDIASPLHAAGQPPVQ